VLRYLALALGLATAVHAEEIAVDIGDADKGKEIFRRCASCHQVGPDAQNRVGPHLNGIFGRVAGGVDDFRNYSDGLVREGKDGLVWEARTLDAYLTNPKSLVSDTRMNFRGLKDAEDRANVLAFLRLFSDSPQDIPEAQPTAIPKEVDLPPEILAIVGDAAYGEYLSSECLTCHQASGTNDGIPAITGWPNEDFVIAMHAYRTKLRPHPVMQMMAGRLSDEEIAALAAYFAELE